MTHLPEAILAAPAEATSSARHLPFRLRRLVSCVRFDEVLVLQGAPLLGAAFSMGRLTVEGLAALSIFAAGSCLLVAHIFVLNDWSGMQADLRDPHRASTVFSARGIGRPEVRRLWTALLALSLLLLAPYGPEPLFIALLIAALSGLYSAARPPLKGMPLWSSALHLLGGFLHFLLGYSAFRGVDGRGVAIGCCMGLIFAAGHLTQEVRDAESDLRNGIRTNAVAFGKARTLAAGLLLFATADLLLLGLAVSRTVPRLAVLAAALFPLHAYWSFQALREGLTFLAVRSLQLRYRVLYASIGALWAFDALFTGR
jgi:4-hydroxybenzoate polyprenyltransferase